MNHTIAICAATGKQGKEILQYFQELNKAQTYGPIKEFHIKALTRNASSPAAVTLSQLPNVTVVQVKYESKESLKSAFEGVDGLYLNYALCEQEAEVEKLILDVAVLECGVRHVIYASTALCEGDHGVPHWESSRTTNEYLAHLSNHINEEGRSNSSARNSDGSGSSTNRDFTYHLLRLAHFNENFLPGSYFPPAKGQIQYPWRSDARFATSSLRDVARVVGKLFAKSWTLDNGSSIHALTEIVTVHDIANAISLSTGTEMTASKGPWIFTTFGHWFGWEASSILHMSKYIDVHEFVVTDLNLTEMKDFLESEIRTEPLETIEAFANRHFGSSTITSAEVE